MQRVARALAQLWKQSGRLQRVAGHAYGKQQEERNAHQHRVPHINVLVAVAIEGARRAGGAREVEREEGEAVKQREDEKVEGELRVQLYNFNRNALT